MDTPPAPAVTAFDGPGNPPAGVLADRRSGRPDTRGPGAPERRNPTIVEELAQALTDTAAQVGEKVADLVGEVRPSWRGWLHTFAFPLSVIAGIVLVSEAPPGRRVEATIYAFTASWLFVVSAAFHRHRWGPRNNRRVQALDHANIWLVIAGTYTPIVSLSLTGAPRTAILTGVWTGAILGSVTAALWPDSPRWMNVTLYGLLACAILPFLPELAAGAGMTATWLIVGSGVVHALGGLAYATRRPGANCRRFGFHEYLHLGTVVGWAMLYAAVSIVVYR